MPIASSRLASWMSAALLISLMACSKSENPVEGEERITETNLFPFASGRTFVYTAYDLDTTGQKIQSSVHRRTMFIQAPVTIGGKNGYRVLDSVYTPGGILAGIDTSYYAEENGNLLTYYGAWVTLFNRSEGLDKEYDAGTFTEYILGIPLTVYVKCKIKPKETISAPIGSYRAYKIEIRSTAFFAGFLVELVQYVWFADGVGPIKQQEPVQVDPLLGYRVNGFEALLVSKNF